MTKFENISTITFGLIVVASIMVTGAVAQTALTPESPTINSNNEEINSVQYLTEDEKARTMNIMNSEPQTKNILDKGEWYVKHIGPRTADSEKYGSLIFIKFEEPIWVEGTFINPFSKESHNVKSWTKSMHVAIDFDTNSVSGIDLGMTRPTTESQLVDSQITSAAILAKEKQTLGEDADSRLIAVYETNDYPLGIAFFSVMSDDDRNEEMIAVNLGDLSIEEKFTGPVWRLSP